MTGGGSHNLHPSAGIIYIKAILKKMKDGEIHTDVRAYRVNVTHAVTHSPDNPLPFSSCSSSLQFVSHLIPLPITPVLSHPPPMPFILFLIPLLNFLVPVTFGSYLACHSTLNNLNLKLNSKLHKPDGFEFSKFAR